MAKPVSRPGASGESLLEELFEHGWDAILTCLPDGTVLSANRAAERLTGYPRQELVGRKVGFDGLRLLPDGLDEAWAAQRASLPPEAPDPELTITLEDRSKTLRTCRVRVVHLDGPAPDASAIFYILNDITEITELRISSDEMKEKCTTLVERSTDVIFQLRSDFVVQFVNPAVQAVMGYDPSELAGARLELTQCLPAEEIRRLRAIGALSILRDGIKNKLFRVLKRDGDLFWGLLTLAPVRKSGNRRLLLGILRDVSEFYKTREQLELQHAQLKRTVSQLEEAYLIQEQFVSNVTHELRTPLTTILITSELLERASRDAWPPPQRRQAELIHKNSKVLMEIINDLLDLAKLKRDGFRVIAQELDIREFLGELVEEVEPLFSQKDLSLQLEVSSEVPALFATDPAVLRKVVTNLLSNAFKFTERGGALVSAQRAGDRLRIAVADTGVGIATENIPNIFEEFRQLDGSDSRRYPGTGLGLPIAEKFTKILGGRIEVDSSPNKGSTFSILLPHLAVQGPIDGGP